MKRLLFIWLIPAVTLIWLAGLCSVRAQDDSGWGTVKGRVIWDSPIPERKPIAAVAQNNDKEHCLSKGLILDEEVVVDPKDKGLRWAFVCLLDGKDPLKPPPIHPDLQAIKAREVVMDQPCCMFVPRALGLREGQILVAKNSSPIPHNFKWTGNPLKQVGGNVLLPPNASFQIKNLPADRLPISIDCNIHGWMHGKVYVFNHPYFRVTDEHGRFQLDKAPAGSFRLRVWHENRGWLGGSAGRNGQPVTIKANDITDVGDLPYN